MLTCSFLVKHDLLVTPQYHEGGCSRYFAKLLALLKLTAYFAYGSLFCRAAPAGLSRRSHEQTVGKGKYKILQEKLRAGKVILPYPC